MSHSQQLSKFGNNIRETYEANFSGRDFVVGDVHGAFPLLEVALRDLKFDCNRDRMFFLGDLVDRGPEVMKVLKLFMSGWGKWAFSIAANHELMFVDWMNENRNGYGFFFARNGGSWAIPNVDDPLLMEFALAASTFPRMVTLQKCDGKQVHLIHAELDPAGETVTDAMISDPEKLLQMMTRINRNGDTSFWGRGTFGYMRKKPKDWEIGDWAKEKIKAQWFSEELSMIISGHTILKQPTKVGKLFCIDTGAYGCFEEDALPEDALSIYEVNQGLTYQVNLSGRLKVVEPFIWTP